MVEWHFHYQFPKTFTTVRERRYQPIAHYSPVLFGLPTLCPRSCSTSRTSSMRSTCLPSDSLHNLRYCCRKLSDMCCTHHQRSSYNISLRRPLVALVVLWIDRKSTRLNSSH